MRAAVDDGRVRAVVVLTGYRPADPAESAYLTDPGVDVLYVTSTAHRVTSAAMHALYEASRAATPASSSTPAGPSATSCSSSIPVSNRRSSTGWPRCCRHERGLRGCDRRRPTAGRSAGCCPGPATATPRRPIDRRPGVVLVPASRHERDAYTAIAAALSERGVASLRIDVRGRGASRGGMSYARMTPTPAPTRRARRRPPRSTTSPRSRASILAGSRWPPSRTPPPTRSSAVGGDQRLRAVGAAVGPPRARALEADGRRPLPVFGLVSKEDREGLRATVDVVPRR